MFGRKEIKRINGDRCSKDVLEIKIAELHQIHPVPRRGIHEGYIASLAKIIETYGYDMRKPVETYRMPNNDLVVVGGHHRIAAMLELHQKNIPTIIRDASTAHPINLAWNMGIGYYTGMYPDFYEECLGNLTSDEQEQVYTLLENWIKNNLY